MKKRIASALLALCLALSLLPGAALAAETVASGICGAEGDGSNVTWALDSDGLLTISGTGEMKAFNLSNDIPWYDRCADIKTAVIDSGVTTIGDSAFMGCGSLTSIRIPNSVTGIERNAFGNCSNLTDVTYTGTKTQWGQITIGNENAPLTETAVIRYTDGDILPKSTAAEIHFYEIFDGTADTWEDARRYCETLGGHLATLTSQEENDYVYQKMCDAGYESAYFGLTDREQEGVWQWVTGEPFQYQNWPAGEPNQENTDEDYGMFYFKYTDGGWNDGDFGGTTVNGGKAFICEWDTEEAYRTYLNQTAISGECGAQGNNLTWTLDASGLLTVSGTGDMANYQQEEEVPWNSYRSSITSFVAESGVTQIGGWALAHCGNLKSVQLPEGLERLLYSSFRYCTGLTSVTLPQSLTSMEGYVFRNSGLNRVQIPAAVTVVGADAFGCSPNLVEIAVDAGNPNYSAKDGVLFNKDQTTLLEYPAGKTGIYHIPDSVTEISIRAFDSCAGMSAVCIPTSVTRIWEYAFDRDSASLKDVYYAGSEADWQAVSIDEGNDALLNAIMHYNATGPEAEFVASGECGDEGGNLTWTLDASGLLTISGAGAMAEYNAGTAPWYERRAEVKTVVINSGVTSIGGSAFEGCGGLTGIEIPSSVTSIGESAFYNCSGLTDITYTGTKAQWGQITIGENNDPLTQIVTVHCTDGDILPGSKDEWENAQNLPDGVKYVPYSERIWTGHAEGGEVLYNFKVNENSALPSGLSLDPDTGVISGVPMKEGTWRIAVSADVDTSGKGRSTAAVLKKVLLFQLTVQDNTNAAVQRPNDYEITKPVGEEDPKDPNHFYMDEYRDEVLEINGPYSEFMRLLINGREQERDKDYTAQEGSTVITIRAQTFRNTGEGTHTIAAEFRAGGQSSGELKRVAQNYTLSVRTTSGGGGGGQPSKPSKKPVQQVQTPQPSSLPFTDVSPSDWFYKDLEWAYQEGLMVGVSDAVFAPRQPVSQAAIVTVLARLARVDLSQFAGVEEEGIIPGQSFTAAAVWARRSGILREDQTFTGRETAAREEMAVMLSKYLQSMGKNVETPVQPVQFADADAMSQEGNDAFQVLYQSGIFKGTGGLRMEPESSTTRAQFVALLHRLSVFAQG